MIKKWWINRKIVKASKSTAKFIVCHGGRGGGRSIGFGDLTLLNALQNPGSRNLCIRGTQVSIKDSSLQILKASIYRQGIEEYFNITENSLSCKNGSQFIFKGAKNYRSIKSTDGVDFVWIDEADELCQEAWDFIIPTVREKNPRFLIGFNPRFATDPVYDMFIQHKKRNAYVFELSYKDNPKFPETLMEELEEMRETNYLKYLHVYEGQLVQTVEGALWRREWIKYYSDDEADQIVNDGYSIFKRIVVGVDPAGTSHEQSDLWGIVGAGKNTIGGYAVINDASGVLSPDSAIKKAVNLHYDIKSDRIVAETNYGGDMVKSLLRNQDQNAPYRDVRATRGKIVRAEPIAALYEQGIVKHLRRFKDLEYEMLTYNGQGKSPNRLDAMVWALTELSGKHQSGGGSVLGV